MKSPYLNLLLLILRINQCRPQEFIKKPKSDGFKDFGPSHRLISFEEEDDKAAKNNVNSFNVSVNYPSSPSKGDTESEASFSHQQIAEGRTFFGTTGGWAGVGNEYCHNHHGYNPACCSLGYSNCCSNSANTFHKKPNFHGSGIGWFASGGGGVGFQHGNHHQHHPQRYPHVHRPHPPVPIRPVLPVVPIRPHHPPVYHNRPILPPQPPYHHHGGGGWGGGVVDKPGSCKPTTSSLLNKLNFFNKAKDIFGKGQELKETLHNHKGVKAAGWGWEPPSHNGGWHFYRRSDISFPSSTPFITKRQVFGGSGDHQGRGESDLSHHNIGGNVIVISRHKLHQDKDIFNNNHNNDNPAVVFQRAQSPNLSFFNNAKLFPFQHEPMMKSSGGNQGRSYQQQGYPYQGNPQWTPKTVGIGSLSGRILGGWNSQSHHHHHCKIDYDCPGHDKCCEGICSAPSFFG